MGLWIQVEIPCAYPMLERVKQEIAAVDGMVDDTAFGADVTVKANVMADKVESLQDRLTELSAGNIQIKKLGEAYRPGPREEV